MFSANLVNIGSVFWTLDLVIFKTIYFTRFHIKLCTLKQLVLFRRYGNMTDIQTDMSETPISRVHVHGTPNRIFPL